ncbi:MAG TPA: MFS transporter [Jatrophihabitantaceae bacterium]|nr:MFS transporter [Jatrophihabitantaceae bacterium]
MTTAVAESAPKRGVIRSALGETAASLRAVFGHRALRRIQLALAGSLIGDWAYATAVIVWAYGVGGAKAVGLFAASRYVLMAVGAPFAATLADRWPRKRVMIGADLARFALVVAAAGCIAAATPAIVVFALAAVTFMLGSVFRPAQAAWLPSLVERPEQLTASNGVASTLESVAFFLGPALGAALVATTDVQTVFLVNAATFLWSAGLVLSIAAPRSQQRDTRDSGPAEGALATMFAGFGEIGRSRDIRLVVFLAAAQTIVAGAFAVFGVVWAVRVLHVGARGVGYVEAVLGVGAIVGGFVALSRASRNKLAGDLTVGVMLWSLPLLLVVAWPSPVTVLAAAALLGLANPLVDVNMFTLLQRLTPDRVMGRVFGALEGTIIATMALGAAVTPFLVSALGLRGAAAVVGLVAGLPALAAVPAARTLDRRLRAPDGLDLLRALPIFAPLAPDRIESLARRLTRTTVPAGEVIMREGDDGDRFYVIESGGVDVTHGTKVIRHEGPGEYFGEIALLRDVPRTATVTATEDTVLLSLERGPFLDAVTGNAESTRAVDDVVSYRMTF